MPKMKATPEQRDRGFARFAADIHHVSLDNSERNRLAADSLPRRIEAGMDRENAASERLHRRMETPEMQQVLGECAEQVEDMGAAMDMQRPDRFEQE